DSLGSASQSVPNNSLTYQDPTRTVPGAISLKVLTDAASSVFRQESDLVDGAGDSVLHVMLIPEGWSTGVLTTRNAALAETTTFRRPILATTTDPITLTYSALAGGASQIGFGRAASLGFAPDTKEKFHSDVEREITETLALTAAGLVQTAVENGTFSRSRTTDASRRGLSAENEAGIRYA